MWILSSTDPVNQKFSAIYSHIFFGLNYVYFQAKRHPRHGKAVWACLVYWMICMHGVVNYAVKRGMR